MLPAHRIWRETVSLLNVKCEHELANEWARCRGEKRQLYNNNCRRLTKTMRSYFWLKRNNYLRTKNMITLITLSYNYTVQASKKREIEKRSAGLIPNARHDVTGSGLQYLPR